jgi:hypothetical protein
MTLSTIPQLVIYSLVILLGISLAILGIRHGRLVAQAQVLVSNVQSLEQGLAFFYADQNRYPTAAEFQNNSLMATYFSAFPPPQFVTAACEHSYEYQPQGTTAYVVWVCLPVGINDLHEGWNRLSQGEVR